MKQAEIAERLSQIEAHLSAIAASLIHRSAPQAQALRDIEASYGLIGQMAEVMHAQREQLEALISRIDRLLALLTTHDQRLEGYSKAADHERTELRELMVQLRELARKQVRTTADLARAVGDGAAAWDGEERRNSIADRRRAS